jgi:tRNA(Ile)-lysidine synthase
MNLSNILYHNFEADPWFKPKKKILLALSGGIDSMVLFDICVQLKLNFTAAYLNYGLRPEENKNEVELIQSTCKKHQINYYIKEISNEEISSLQVGNLQEKARNIRYQWFEELRKEHQFEYLFTAHHAQDQAETILFKLSRGTSLNGLTGMHLANDWHIRPLLFTLKHIIEEYANTNQITFCKDSSNDSLKYTRNKIRHQLIPPLELVFPQAIAQISKTAIRLQDTEALLNELVHQFVKNHCQQEDSNLIIPTHLLLEFKQHTLMLYHIIKPFGFNWVQTENIIEGILNMHEGAEIMNENYQIVFSRNYLYIFKKLKPKNPLTLKQLEGNFIFHEQEILMSLHAKKDITNLKDGSLYLDAAKLNLPLTLRNIKQGDKFKPYGLNGTKLVSDYIQEKKLNPIQKSQLMVLVANEEIIAIPPFTMHHKFAVNEETTQILKITHKKR